MCSSVSAWCAYYTPKISQFSKKCAPPPSLLSYYDCLSRVRRRRLAKQAQSTNTTQTEIMTEGETALGSIFCNVGTDGDGGTDGWPPEKE